jgi:hypothetical protein
VWSAGKKLENFLKANLRSAIGLKCPWHSMAVLAQRVLVVVEHWVSPLGHFIYNLHTYPHIPTKKPSCCRELLVPSVSIPSVCLCLSRARKLMYPHPQIVKAYWVHDGSCVFYAAYFFWYAFALSFELDLVN